MINLSTPVSLTSFASFAASLVVAASLLMMLAVTASAELAPPQTCTGPGLCPDFGYRFQHIKRIECGPWPDGLAFWVEIDQGDLPLAGAAGYSQPDQCELLRRAIAGDL
jgi:hypothetical protein